MHVELVRTVTKDGLRLDGALTRTQRASEGVTLTRRASEGVTLTQRASEGVTQARSASKGPGTNAALLLHGVGGNFYSVRTLEPLIAKLNEAGISTLVVNTRGHDAVFEANLGNVRRRFGAAFEIVDECRLDIAAWLELLSSRGYEQVALIGHSLGAVKSVYAQAHENFRDVSAVVAISGPRLSYAAYRNAESSSRFWESMQTAERLVQDGRSEELFTSKFPFPLLISAGQLHR